MLPKSEKMMKGQRAYLTDIAAFKIQFSWIQ